jgi:hypothetical protein
MKVAVGRCPESGAQLASQSTISRLENAPSKTEAARLFAALLDQAWFRVDAHLSRGERHDSGGDPAHHKSHKRHRRPMTSYGVGIAPRRMRDTPARNW